MNPITILFGIVLSSAYGTAFHVLRGGGLKRLFLYVILAWLGFWVGHTVGGLIGLKFASLGTLNTGVATIGSVLFLIVGDWLSRVEVTQS